MRAECAGIDAAHRLVAVARDRNPGADIRVGDMHALPWDDASFDVAIGFWGSGAPPRRRWTRSTASCGPVAGWGSRCGATSRPRPVAWALAPFRMGAAAKVANQAAMVSLGRPGVGEDMLARSGFVDVERIEVPFVWEFADPEAFARAGLHRAGVRGDAERR